jgi:hypothetical protein
MAEARKIPVVGLYDHARDVPRGTPTPTQEELNKINLRRPDEEVKLADDGSGEDPYAAANREAQERAQGGIVRREGGTERTTQPRVTQQKPPGA